MTEDKQKFKLNITFKDVCMYVGHVVSFILLFLLSFIIVVGMNRLLNNHNCPKLPDAFSTVQSLQSAAAIYVAQQQVSPEVFSDFIITSGTVSEPATFSLENINSTVVGLDSKELKLSFDSDCEATYYLNGTDVTATYNFDVRTHQTHVTNKQPEQEQNNFNKFFNDPTFQYFSFYVAVFIFTVVSFFIIRIVLKTYVISVFCLLVFCVVLLYIVVPPDVSYKPAIYLYPQKPTEVKVILDEQLYLTLDIPKYNQLKGWNVLAYPDGKMVDLQPEYTNCNILDPARFGMEYAKEACINNDYPYLYWEGMPLNTKLPPQTKGWLVKTAQIKEFLKSKLDYVGFNKAESEEFIRYWAHKIIESNKKTVFISFMQTEAVNNYHSMTITPTPDSINRFYIVVDYNVKDHKDPQPQILTVFKREGFTVVDWGGCVISNNNR